MYVQVGTIKQGQTVVVSYTDPTAGDDTIALQDIAGNDVASFTTGMSGVPAVTNNSTNTAATGEPAITGTAQVGQELTADATPIMDTDGLTGVDFTYQWLRVDADGTSNEEEITGEILATYTLTDDDVGTKVKVKVSFMDELSGPEMRNSAAYPSSGTVTAAGTTNTAAMGAPTITGTAAGGQDADGGHHRHHGCGRADQPHLHVPVDPGGRRRRRPTLRARIRAPTPWSTPTWARPSRSR